MFLILSKNVLFTHVTLITYESYVTTLQHYIDSSVIAKHIKTVTVDTHIPYKAFSDDLKFRKFLSWALN